MSNTLLIFFGAGLGGVLRYWIANGVYALFGRQFPYGTLFVNTTGSFLMGFLFVILLGRFTEISSELRALLLIGGLGGYTTFSSFSIETVLLFENGAAWNAVLNVLLSVVLCLVFCWLGVLGGRQV